MEQTAAFSSPVPLCNTTTKATRAQRCRSYSNRSKDCHPSVRRRRCHATATASGSGSTTTPLASPNPALSSDVCWEIDFYSRPILDKRGKKVWELIIASSDGEFEHVEQVPNSAVNSKELRRRVQLVLDTVDPARCPQNVRFFRAEMANMIRIALEALGIDAKASRRCHALIKLVKNRENNVYPEMKGYDKSLARNSRTNLVAGIGPGVGPAALSSIAEKMPDSMRGEKFLFTDFSLGEIEAFFKDSDPNDYFGNKCLVDGNIDQDFRIPGLSILSERAKGVAAWTSGSDVVYIKARMETKNVTFECGIRTSYLLAKINPSLKEDVKKFEEAKTYSGGLHFLAIQDKQNPELVEGFWLLRDVEML